MFDEAKAQKTLRFIHNLKHTKGTWHGKNFDLLPWQEQVIRDLFGTVKEDGYRQYNTAYIEIPKKMGFDNKGTFEIYQNIKNQMEDFNEELVREFAEELTRKIRSKIYIGWQEVTQEYNRMEGEVALLAANPKYDSLNLDVDGELGKTLMKSILKNFSLN